MKIYCIKYALILLLLLPLSVNAQFKEYAVGLNAGTNGLGIDLTTDINDKLNLRATGNFYAFSGIFEVDDDPSVELDTKSDNTNFSLLINYHPFRSSFGLVTGLYYMNWNTTMFMAANETYEIEDRIFQPEELGSLDGVVEYPSKLAPYLGMALGNPVGEGTKLKLNLQLGIMYMGTPELKMSGEGMIAPSAGNQPSLQEAIEQFQWYPMLNLGLSFRI